MANDLKDANKGLSRRKLTARQAERNEGALSATLEILKENGFDKTFVQDVAKRSLVSLGTLYAHFHSKDYLIYRATEKWVAENTIRALPSNSAAPIEVRMIKMVRSSAEVLFAEPLLLEAWVRANLSNDPDVVSRVKGAKRTTSLSMYPAEEFSSPELAQDISMIMEHVWFTGIVRWTLGQKELLEVPRDVERAMLLVFKAYRATD